MQACLLPLACFHCLLESRRGHVHGGVAAVAGSRHAAMLLLSLRFHSTAVNSRDFSSAALSLLERQGKTSCVTKHVFFFRTCRIFLAVAPPAPQTRTWRLKSCSTIRMELPRTCSASALSCGKPSTDRRCGGVFAGGGEGDLDCCPPPPCMTMLQRIMFMCTPSEQVPRQVWRSTQALVLCEDTIRR